MPKKDNKFKLAPSILDLAISGAGLASPTTKKRTREVSYSSVVQTPDKKQKSIVSKPAETPSTSTENKGTASPSVKSVCNNTYLDPSGSEPTLVEGVMALELKELPDATESEVLQPTLVLSDTTTMADQEGASSSRNAAVEPVAKKMKKKKQEILHVHVHLGRDNRLSIRKPVFEAFMDQLFRRLSKPDEFDKDQITIEFSEHANGKGIIGCSNQTTVDWIKIQAMAFKHDGQSIRAWTKDEFGRQVVYKCFFNGYRWRKETGQSALSGALKFDGWNKQGSFQVINWINVPKQNGMNLRFEADEELQTFLEEKGLRIRAKICVLNLKRTVQGEAMETSSS